MSLSSFIAKRYFFSNHGKNFVHIVSWVSFFGVVIGTAALVLMLSVFNGFENVVLSMYNAYDSDLKITYSKGKTFNAERISNHLAKNKDILVFSNVLEEKALLKNKSKEFIAKIKGVDYSYRELTNFDSLLVEGNYINDYEQDNVAIIGTGIAYYLSMGLGSIFEQLQIFIPNRKAKTLLNTTNAFKQSVVLPVGIFSIQNELDEQLVITPISFLQKLCDKENEISAIEIQLKDADKMLIVQQNLIKLLGEEYVVENRFEQQKILYKILNTEKLAIFLIFTFIMIISTFNILGSLTMLILDKKHEIKIFKSFGATQNQIRNIFFKKSMLTILFGVIVGLLIGLLIGFLQQEFGFIRINSNNLVIDSYPVDVRLFDVFLVFINVLVIGFLASWYPSKVLIGKFFKQ